MGGLEEAIVGRGDHVAIPALGALSEVGGAGQVDKMLGVLGSGDVSDAVRIAAADAIGAIGSRTALAETVADPLRGMIGGDASIEVRSAAARALGRMNLGAPARAGVLEAVRVRVGAPPSDLLWRTAPRPVRFIGPAPSAKERASLFSSPLRRPSWALRGKRGARVAQW